MQTMFFNRLFNKSKSTDYVKQCTHCKREDLKLKKCQQCGERLICKNCYHGTLGRMEKMCSKCDIEYIIWLKKLELLDF